LCARRRRGRQCWDLDHPQPRSRSEIALAERDRTTRHHCSRNHSSIDVTAADAISELNETLQTAGIELCFAEMKDPVKDKLKRFELFERFGARTFFATVGEAVSAYLATRSVDWIDWEDRTP
jgi:MFS superfamily sulfate permease-like transporter